MRMEIEAPFGTRIPLVQLATALVTEIVTGVDGAAKDVSGNAYDVTEGVALHALYNPVSAESVRVQRLRVLALLLVPTNRILVGDVRV